MATPKHPKNEIRPSVFDKPTAKSDVAIVVEGRRLYVNKAILSTASDVFDRMLNGDFKEQQQAEIPLPGKSRDDIVDMLLCIYPSELRPVTRETVDKLLELADEYQIVGLKRRCEEFLLPLCKTSIYEHVHDCNDTVHFLYLADKYELETLLEIATDTLSNVSINQIRYGFSIANHEDYTKLSSRGLAKLLRKRVDYLEKRKH
ncbi:BTB and MATH domain-containing protein 36-like [Haliotis cracherodii]|uniref:BTB and MATH domain-containing protein 36-like n=1 Tax=Haliotis cracherodii TaxID=6455 RepID=UPI0039E78C25